ncbi:MAG: phage holin family protein [Lachnotalea sp.]
MDNIANATFLMQYIDLVTLGICLCVGFAIKQAFTWLDNKYIPLSMLILGTFIAIFSHLGEVSASVILSGMISGLASTGLYEMMRNLLNKEGSSTTKE